MKTAFLILLLVHGLIHLLGTAKGFQLAEVAQLTRPISRLQGIFWTVSAVLFFASFFLLLADSGSWWIAACAALAISQILIVQSWTDAKWGTIANVIILLPTIAAFLNALPSSFVNTYRREVTQRLSQAADSALLGEGDIRKLLIPVQKYLRYTGAIGKPRVHNFRAVFDGDMKRSATSDWIRISSQQYNFFGDRARLFFIQSSLFGIPFDGLHVYTGSNATMRINVASTFQVVHAQGEEMTHGETVTLFNDMCLLAPATLIDSTIGWASLDSLTVKATFTNAGNTITALLSFNESGQMINFTSNDRFLSSDGKTYQSYPWSTPTRDYKDYGGTKAPSSAEALWQTPDGPFVYARFSLRELEYNCRDLKMAGPDR